MRVRGFRWIVAPLVACGALAVWPSAAPAGADVLPTDGNGCPAGGDPNTALPCVTFEVRCESFGLVLGLANGAGAGENATFTISTAAGVDDDVVVVVAPDGSTSRTVPILEDGSVVVSVTEAASGREFIVDEPFSIDCTAPTAVVGDVSCEGPVGIVVDNQPGGSGSNPVDFRLDIYDGAGADPTRQVEVLDVDGPSGATVPLGDDGQLRIVVVAVADNGPAAAATSTVVADRTQSVDCVEPSIAIAAACRADGDVDVTLSAPAGQDETAFELTITDAEGTPVVQEDLEVPPGGATTVSSSALGDGRSYDLRVSEAGATEVVGTSEFAAACRAVSPTTTATTTSVGAGATAPTSVAPGGGSDTSVGAGALARTGSSPTATLSVALVLLAGGAVLLTRRRRRPGHLS
jgi:LPXTG-motif cell wall-anchored protein